MSTTKKSTPVALNPNNPFALYLAKHKAVDEPRWLYERARIRREMGMSRSHFARIIDGHACSLDVALQLHELTAGEVSAEAMCPNAPWERMKRYYLPE